DWSSDVCSSDLVSESTVPSSDVPSTLPIPIRLSNANLIGTPPTGMPATSVTQSSTVSVPLAQRTPGDTVRNRSLAPANVANSTSVTVSGLPLTMSPSPCAQITTVLPSLEIG